MQYYVLKFRDIDKSALAEVGGKGANLGEMTKAGLPVPQGFCVTTQAFRTFLETHQEISVLFSLLDEVRSDQRDRIAELGKRIRDTLTSTSIPSEIRTAIAKAWETAGPEHAYAVRSSATAEDLPTASFAGQQDTYLNIIGLEPLLQSVRACWASLFTDRAISYRAKHGFDHRAVLLSVVVQRMVFPDVSGIMFTADPITGNRNMVCIDASYGLGEALVSGLVTADLYQIRAGQIVTKKISKKEKAIEALPEGGTVIQDLLPAIQESQALTDIQILELAALGRKIEDHYETEQDIEWGLVAGKFYILQSRPITSLYPVPPVNDRKPHVFINLGYIQMMTAPMKPLAISVLSCIPNFLKDAPDSPKYQFIHEAGGRVFADVTGALLLRPVRNRMLKVLNGMDEQLASALEDVVLREEYSKASVSKKNVLQLAGRVLPIFVSVIFKVFLNRYLLNPSKARTRAEAYMDKLVEETEQRFSHETGADRIRLIQSSMGNIVPGILTHVAVYLITGVLAAGSLKKQLKQQTDSEQAASLLNQLNKSLPGNVTTEIGLAIGDLADKARDYPELVRYLQHSTTSDFTGGLDAIPGGALFKSELSRFLQKYGMRCASEIDITQPRWIEDPSQLLPSLISNIQVSSSGEHLKKYKQGVYEAEKAAEEIVARFGAFRKRKANRLVRLYRNLMGMREHHKFAVIRLFELYKKMILEESRYLMQKGILQCEEDVFYFSLDELKAMLEDRYQEVPTNMVLKRKNLQVQYAQKKSPRVMTGEGEIISGKRRDVKAPDGALLGTPVSAGVVEGKARVIVRLEDAKLKPGEILVAPYTDPGWTPLFTSAIGLVTEVGGMMTHGSVIAREYGIPAVVGIEGAVERIQDGARIRVDGTNGFVEILEN